MYKQPGQLAANALVKIVLGVVIIAILFVYVPWSIKNNARIEYREQQALKHAEATTAINQFQKENRKQYAKNIKGTKDPSVLELTPENNPGMQECKIDCTIP